MVDSIDESDVARIDAAVDPQAIHKDDVVKNLKRNPNLDGGAVAAFADRVADKRGEVRQQARDLLDKRIEITDSGPRVRDAQGRFASGIPDELTSVNTDVSDRGDVTVQFADREVDLGRIDLNAGTSGRRRDRSREGKHPAQRPGGGR